ncbi:MAG: NADH-quinone oxidoreductase subunit C [Prevotella sp.]|nr:NADH-quinone oxidoreductase subunit C [Prevotella sp.]
MKLNPIVFDFDQFASEMANLKNQKGFDYLVTIVGEDFGLTPDPSPTGEGSSNLGCIYILENTESHERCSVKIIAREAPSGAVGGAYCIPSVINIWKVANLLEREVFDFYGIKFLGHPDMRRLFLRSDFKGYPFRKDFKADGKYSLEDDDEPDYGFEYSIDKNGRLVEKKNPLFTDDEYVINIGPQHPSTHGVLRLQTVLDGETVKRIYPHLGYIHRGIEKMSEELTYPQTLALTDRLNYLSAMMHRHALVGVIEEALEVELTDRIKTVRTIMDELQRLDSHLLFCGCCAQDLGALTAFLYCMRDREHVLNVMEETTGGRLIQNYYRIGGLQDDIDPNFVKNVKDLCAYLRPMIQEYMDVFGDNVITHNRLENVGPMSLEDCINYGVTGPAGRASGWKNDVRKNHPYDMYDKVEWKQITLTGCDSMDRYLVHIQELYQSLDIIEQLIDNIPEGDYYVKQKPIIKLPEGQWYFSVEGSAGEFGVYLDSRGDKSPYRLKLRPMGLSLVGALDPMLRGQKIADLVTTGAAIDIVIPDIDR